jgi:DNA-binding MarR family transcriptional regulator
VGLPKYDQQTSVDVAMAPTARIARVARLLRRALDDALQSYGLTAPQLGLLNRLYAEDGLVQAELGRRMLIEPATLTGMVQRLEHAGWVRRGCDPDNRRLQRVWLTEQAGSAIPHLHEIQDRHRSRALAGLASEELTLLESMLARMESNLSPPNDG